MWGLMGLARAFHSSQENGRVGAGFDNDGWRRSKEGYRENKRIEKQIELSLATNSIFNRKRFHLSKHRIHPYS